MSCVYLPFFMPRKVKSLYILFLQTREKNEMKRTVLYYIS